MDADVIFKDSVRTYHEDEYEFSLDDMTFSIEKGPDIWSVYEVIDHDFVVEGDITTLFVVIGKLIRQEEVG